MGHYSRNLEKTQVSEAVLRASGLEDPFDMGALTWILLSGKIQRRTVLTTGSWLATKLNGFKIVPKWKSPVGGGHRGGFVGVPFLSATKAGSSFTLEFTGRGVGFFMVCGPDAGIIKYRIDGGKWKSRDSFTKWSRRLNIPWALILDAELKAGKHVLDVRLSATKIKTPKVPRCTFEICWSTNNLRQPSVRKPKIVAE